MKPIRIFFMISLFVSLMLTPFLAQGQEQGSANWPELTEEYVEFLNQNYPRLDLWSHTYGLKAYQDLKQLEDNLQGDYSSPAYSLKELSCSKIVCGGGGGPCPTCFQ